MPLADEVDFRLAEDFQITVYLLSLRADRPDSDGLRGQIAESRSFMLSRFREDSSSRTRPGCPPGRRTVDGHAQAQRHGEPLHRPRAEEEQGRRRDQRGHVGVHDGHEGLVVARVDGGADRLAQLQLLPDALQDQDVAVHRHPDPQGDPRDARAG